MRCMLVLVAIVVSGCSDDHKPAPATPPAPKRFDRPMPITFGDCGHETERFLSGPRPQGFAPHEPSGLGASGSERPTTPATFDLSRNAGYVGPIAQRDQGTDLLGKPIDSDNGFGFVGTGQFASAQRALRLRP